MTRRIGLIEEIKELITGQLAQEYRAVESNMADWAARQEQMMMEGGMRGDCFDMSHLVMTDDKGLYVTYQNK